MAKPETKTILVRVPAEIVQAAQKLKKEENLPTIGTAIRYWIEQQQNELQETKLLNLEEKIESLGKNVRYILKRSLYREAKDTVNNITLNKVLYYLERGVKKLGKLKAEPEDFKVDNFELEQLREVKSDLEILDMKNSRTYEVACAFLFVSGQTEEDRSRQMEGKFLNLLKDMVEMKKSKSKEKVRKQSSEGEHLT